MSDVSVAITMVRSGTLSNDQIMLFHLNGLLRPPGVRVQFLGNTAPYQGGEVAELHSELAAELVRRGAATYVV